MQPSPKPAIDRRAVFLDRDGVINRDHGYVSRREDFEFLPGAIAGMLALSRAGFELIVVTNQSGIARGLYDAAAFQDLTHWMRAYLAQAHVPIRAVYHCPHHPDGVVPDLARVCDCRKPAPGMLLRAKAEHGIDMAASIMIGDKRSDVAAARAARVGRALLLGGAATDPAEADAVFPDLPSCAVHVLERTRWTLPKADGLGEPR